LKGTEKHVRVGVRAGKEGAGEWAKDGKRTGKNCVQLVLEGDQRRLSTEEKKRAIRTGITMWRKGIDLTVFHRMEQAPECLERV